MNHLVNHLATMNKEQLRNKNNPNKEPTGSYTGRCSECGSKDLWDDAMWYGCNCCGAMFTADV